MEFFSLEMSDTITAKKIKVPLRKSEAGFWTRVDGKTGKYAFEAPAMEKPTTRFTNL